MDRFEYSEPRMCPGESSVTQERNIKLYDGEDKTTFENGDILLTTHRLLWGHSNDIEQGRTCLSLSLRYVVFIEEEQSGTFSFSKSKKIIIHLSESLPGKLPGPINRSRYNYIKLGFKSGIEHDFLGIFNDIILKKRWESLSPTQPPQPQNIKLRTGIVGIERSIQEKQRTTDKNIEEAFRDLNKLMVMAKDMVSLSKSVSQKIKEKHGDITEDETIKFKSYLLSLGIDDPVTRDTYETENQYYQNLARQLAKMLEEPIKEAGGMVALTDIYCRVNRARGLELLSPEDLLHACRIMDKIHLPMRLCKFNSGVMVLQLNSHNDAQVVDSTAALLEEKLSVSPEELAQSLRISVLLAKERLITTEEYGMACRDESIEGLRFYPNLFLRKG